MKRMWWFGVGLSVVVALAVGGWAIRDTWYQDLMTKRNRYELAGNVTMAQQQVPVLQPDGSWRVVEQPQPSSGPILPPGPGNSVPVFANPGGSYLGNVQERAVTGPDGNVYVERTLQRPDGTTERSQQLLQSPRELPVTAMREMQAYLQAYQAAPEGSEQRAKMRAEIERGLSEQYDRHLSQHVQQVEELEARVAKLRQQLDRRQAAKARLVELRLELMLSQADGLGWPEGPGDLNLNPSYPQSRPLMPSQPGTNQYGSVPSSSFPNSGLPSPNNTFGGQSSGNPGGVGVAPGQPPINNNSSLRIPSDPNSPGFALGLSPLQPGAPPAPEFQPSTPQQVPGGNFRPNDSSLHNDSSLPTEVGPQTFDRQGYSLPTEEARPIPVDPPATTPAPAAAPALEPQRPTPSGSPFITDQDLASNVIKQSMLAVHNYYDVYQKFPFRHHAADDPQDHNDLSWLVRVLPYLDGGEDTADLFSQFDLSQSWDSPQNRPLLEKIPAILARGPGSQTQLRWVPSYVKKFGDITDGASNTIALIHGGPQVRWTENMPLTQEEALELFLSLSPGQELVVGMYDGSVRRLTRDNTTQSTFEAMLTPNGGERVAPRE